ncbi:hypothetical protein PFISCL1PPCAC_7099, partial [Pristionchus fissidentatus]
FRLECVRLASRHLRAASILHQKIQPQTKIVLERIRLRQKYFGSIGKENEYVNRKTLQASTCASYYTASRWSNHGGKHTQAIHDVIVQVCSPCCCLFMREHA